MSLREWIWRAERYGIPLLPWGILLGLAPAMAFIGVFAVGIALK